MNPKREVLDALDDPEQEGWLASYLDLYAHKLAEQQRRQAAQIAILRSEEARLTAKGLRMGADLIDPRNSTEELRP